MQSSDSAPHGAADAEALPLDEILEVSRSSQNFMMKSISARYRYRIGDFRKREGENAYRRLAKKIVEQYARGKLDAASYVFPEAAFQIIRSKMNKK